MVTYPGYEELIKKIYTENQEHVFNYWDELNDDQKSTLLEDLKSINFEEFNMQFGMTKSSDSAEIEYSPAEYISIPEDNQESEHFEKARAEGKKAISEGRVCAFVVAGGQGSRLGFNGPKGAFKISPIKNKSLFQIHAEKILKNEKLYNVEIPFLIMTSQMNYNATITHFEENSYFGMKKSNVHFFKQDMIPSMDTNGKLILSSPCTIFKNPDGHGGSLTALNKSGLLTMLKEKNIDLISYFQVDNPIAQIIDPIFLGFHILENAEISSKALRKAYPQEKVGNFVKYPNGSLGVVEYSDMPEDKAYEKNSDGSLRYSGGNIAIHIFDRNFVEKITSGHDAELPFHIARKKIKAFVNGKEKEIDGFKFEKFVFDALPLTTKNTLVETLRRIEFAPVKNKTGLDSVDSSRQLMSDLFRSWLENREIQIPDNVSIIEISPLVALDQNDLSEDLVIPDTAEVYIG